MPCDGRDDLCFDFEDELACSESLSLLHLLSIVLMGAVVLFVLMKIAECTYHCCRRCCVKKSIEDGATSCEDQLVLANLEKNAEAYSELRTDDTLGSSVSHTLFCLKHDGDFEQAREFCQRLYNLELAHNDGHLADTFDYFYRTLGNADTTSFFFANVDNDWDLQARAYFSEHLPSGIRKLKKSRFLAKVLAAAKFIVKIVLWYSDLIKDWVLAFAVLNAFVPTGPATLDDRVWRDSVFPVSVFAVITASIIGSHFANVLVVCGSSHLGIAQKIFGSLLIPLLPMMIQYAECRAETRIVELMTGGKSEESKLPVSLARQRRRILRYRSLRADLRASENALEHVVQITILGLVLLVDRSNTATVTGGIARVISDKADYLVALSAAVSFLSIVRGQIFLVCSRKNGYQPLSGQAILFLYYAVGTAGRVFAVLLFFTPSLGLFDTFYHGKLGALTTPAQGNLTGTLFRNYAVIDVDADGEPVHLGDLWNRQYRLERPEQLFHLPTWVVATVISAFMVVHILASSALQKRIYYKEQDPGRFTRLREGLVSLVCPPIHLDWEYLYRSGYLTVARCW